ncbi:MAG TPA: hypothetical protein VGA56_15790, partial [Opitutaceae bacterium]
MHTDSLPGGYQIEERYIAVADLPDRWEILNPSLAHLNNMDVRYLTVQQRGTRANSHAVFYVPGLAGDMEDLPGLDELVCPHARLVRVEAYGLRRMWMDVLFTTFGDICALLRTSRQSVSTIADRLELTSFDIIGPSWGGFIAMLTAFNDPRCRRVFAFVSTPDICDALSRMYHLVPPLPKFAAVLDVLQSGHIRRDAEAAKSGQAEHQTAWNAISPWTLENIKHRDFELLFLNRDEDETMRRWNVEHWIEWARAVGLNVDARFVNLSEEANCHNLPFDV